MNTTIYKQMKNYMIENKCKQCWFTCDEWGSELGITLTPQRMTAMYKAGLVDRKKDKHYFGDNKYRYDII